MKSLVDIYAGSGRKLLAKELVTLYEDVQDFQVAELDGAGRRLRCAARAVGGPGRGPHAGRPSRPRATSASAASCSTRLIATARELGLSRLFALTFHTDFFGRAGFVPIDGAPVDHDTYDALRRSYDPGVAEFLESRVRQAEHARKHPDAAASHLTRRYRAPHVSHPSRTLASPHGGERDGHTRPHRAQLYARGRRPRRASRPRTRTTSGGTASLRGSRVLPAPALLHGPAPQAADTPHSYRRVATRNGWPLAV